MVNHDVGVICLGTLPQPAQPRALKYEQVGSRGARWGAWELTMRKDFLMGGDAVHTPEWTIHGE